MAGYKREPNGRRFLIHGGMDIFRAGEGQVEQFLRDHEGHPDLQGPQRAQHQRPGRSQPQGQELLQQPGGPAQPGRRRHHRHPRRGSSLGPAAVVQLDRGAAQLRHRQDRQEGQPGGARPPQPGNRQDGAEEEGTEGPGRPAGADQQQGHRRHRALRFLRRGLPAGRQAARHSAQGAAVDHLGMCARPVQTGAEA